LDGSSDYRKVCTVTGQPRETWTNTRSPSGISFCDTSVLESSGLACLRWRSCRHLQTPYFTSSCL